MEAVLRLGLLCSDASYGLHVCCICLENCSLHRLALGGLLRRSRLAVRGAWASWSGLFLALALVLVGPHSSGMLVLPRRMWRMRRCRGFLRLPLCLVLLLRASWGKFSLLLDGSLGWSEVLSVNVGVGVGLLVCLGLRLCLYLGLGLGLGLHLLGGQCLLLGVCLHLLCLPLLSGLCLLVGACLHLFGLRVRELPLVLCALVGPFLDAVQCGVSLVLRTALAPCPPAAVRAPPRWVDWSPLPG